MARNPAGGDGGAPGVERRVVVYQGPTNPRRGPVRDADRGESATATGRSRKPWRAASRGAVRPGRASDRRGLEACFRDVEVGLEVPHAGARRVEPRPAFEIFGSCLAPPTASLQIANPTCASSPFSSLLLRPRSCPVTGRGRSHSRRTQATRSTRKPWFLLPARPRSRSPSPSRPWRPPRRRPTGPSRRSPAPRSRARAADRADARAPAGNLRRAGPRLLRSPGEAQPEGHAALRRQQGPQDALQAAEAHARVPEAAALRGAPRAQQEGPAHGVNRAPCKCG